MVVFFPPSYNHLHPPLCSGSQPRHLTFLHWFRQLFDMYRSRPKFFFGFHTEMTHDDNNDVQALDDDLVTFLRDLEAQGHLNSTLLILMADHGARYGYIRQSAQGKLEERMPHFSFRFPPWFRRQHPELVRNMEVNAGRLTTPFDVHETFLEMLNYTGPGTADVKGRRGVSLFKEISEERTCGDAEVTPYWCVCLAWQSVDQSEAAVEAAVRTSLAALNSFTEGQREKCAELTLSEITQASRYVCTDKDTVAQRKMQLYSSQYQGGGGGGGGFNGVVCLAGHEYYRLSFVTKPGDGHFELVCYHDVSSGSFRISESEISRTDKYGSQPACIQQSMPHLRPYCYCV